MEARVVKEVIAGGVARPREDMKVTTSLVGRKASAKEGVKTLATASVEKDRQGMIASALSSTP